MQELYSSVLSTGLETPEKVDMELKHRIKALFYHKKLSCLRQLQRVFDCKGVYSIEGTEDEASPGVVMDSVLWTRKMQVLFENICSPLV